MSSKKYVRLGKITALLSFLIGVLIFAAYFFTSNSNLISIGYVFIALTVLVNLIVLIAILIQSKKDSENKKILLRTAGIMLLNLPVLLCGVWMVLVLLGNMRITFTNSTQDTLSDIHITGCETEHMAVLKPNESKTIWVAITGDCLINIDYSQNGKVKEETVVEYVTSGMGQRLKYDIGGDNRSPLQ